MLMYLQRYIGAAFAKYRQGPQKGYGQNRIGEPNPQTPASVLPPEPQLLFQFLDSGIDRVKVIDQRNSRFGEPIAMFLAREYCYARFSLEITQTPPYR